MEYSAEDLKKWQEKMLAMPASQRVGQQDPKAVINGDKPDVKGALTPPTAAPNSLATAKVTMDDFQDKGATPTPTTMPSSLSPAPMDAAKQQYNQDLLGKKQDLAATLKQYARGEIQVDPNQMVKDASALDVSRGQLSNLYQQYRKEAKDSPLKGGSSLVPPNKDTYSDGSTFGEGLGRGRSLESESGKAMRIARKLQRQGFGSAAERMALAGAEAKMTEPSIKSQEYVKQQDVLKKVAAAEEQRNMETRRRELALKNKMLTRFEKEADSPDGLSPATASYFGYNTKQNG